MVSRSWTRKPRPAPETGRILQQHGHSQPHDRQQQQQHQQQQQLQLLCSPCLLGRLACCLRTLDCRLGLLEPGSLAPPPPPTCSAVSVSVISVLCSIAGIRSVLSVLVFWVLVSQASPGGCVCAAPGARPPPPAGPCCRPSARSSLNSRVLLFWNRYLDSDKIFRWELAPFPCWKQKVSPTFTHSKNLVWRCLNLLKSVLLKNLLT